MSDNSIKPIKTTQYLYGVDPSHFDSFEYWDAIQDKVRLGILLKQTLTSQRSSYPFNSKECNDLRDRYDAVNEAIRYNRALIIERYPNIKI